MAPAKEAPVQAAAAVEVVELVGLVELVDLVEVVEVVEMEVKVVEVVEVAPRFAGTRPAVRCHRCCRDTAGIRKARPPRQTAG